MVSIDLPLEQGEALLAASVRFKFNEDERPEPYFGSPQLAAALVRIRDAVVRASESDGQQGACRQLACLGRLVEPWLRAGGRRCACFDPVCLGPVGWRCAHPVPQELCCAVRSRRRRSARNGRRRESAPSERVDCCARRSPGRRLSSPGRGTRTRSSPAKEVVLAVPRPKITCQNLASAGLAQVTPWPTCDIRACRTPGVIPMTGMSKDAQLSRQ